jgi:hypothetical protein
MYFFWTGGSALPDASTQNLVAGGMLALAATGSVYMAWMAYGRTVRWKGNELRVRSLLGTERTHRFSDVTAVHKSELRGDYRLTFRNGSTLWLPSAYFDGGNEMLRKLPRRAFGK